MKIHKFRKRVSFSNNPTEPVWEMYHLRDLVNAGLEALEKKAEKEKLRSCDVCRDLVEQINELMEE